jgi:hypothetical protein
MNRSGVMDIVRRKVSNIEGYIPFFPAGAE